MPLTARAFWTVGPGRGELREASLPAPDAETEMVLVHTLASGVSRGTEALVFAGRVPPSQYAAMRAPLMEGAFPFPVKYGYSAVGVTAGGERVFVLHPHQDQFLAPRPMCFTVPAAVPNHRAVLAANMETALNVTWDAAAAIGERIMVIGAGVVGLLAAYLLRRISPLVTLVDIRAERAPLAQAFGCAFAMPAQAPTGQELIVHASASAAGLRLALASAATEGRIVETSWYGDGDIPLPLGEAFHARRLRLVSSQVGAIGAAMQGRRTHAERLTLALELLADTALDRLLDATVPFDMLPDIMPRILSPAHGGLCHVVTYEGS